MKWTPTIQRARNGEKTVLIGDLGLSLSGRAARRRQLWERGMLNNIAFMAVTTLGLIIPPVPPAAFVEAAAKFETPAEPPAWDQPSHPSDRTKVVQRERREREHLRSPARRHMRHFREERAGSSSGSSGSSGRINPDNPGGPQNNGPVDPDNPGAPQQHR